MGKTNNTSVVIDRILALTATTGFIAGSLLLPGLAIGLDKPMQKLMKHLDKRERERELMRVVRYMRSQRLVSGNYQHGLQITPRGHKRLAKAQLDSLQVVKPPSWDKNWRLIFFDIPEPSKAGRDQLIIKLKGLGFYQLQRSVWVHPFPCREVIEELGAYYQIDQYITYVETAYIDNQRQLAKKFHRILR